MQLIFGMSWLNEFIWNLLHYFGIDNTSLAGQSLQFFLFDTLKILILLCIVIFIISYIQSYFSPERSRKILGHFHGIVANCIGALLGTVTPFCSCSSIPLFIGFSSAGLPIGVTFSFLISSPLVDLASLVLLMSIFGWKIAIVYVTMGLVLAVVGGTLIEKLNMDRYVEDFVKTAGAVSTDILSLSYKDRIKYAAERTWGTLKRVFWYIIAGVAIGAVIHNWIPENIIQSVIGNKNPFSVILATLVGIPIYADIFGTIPIAEALYLKGIGIGTVLSFMMAVTALSLPSILMLRNAIKPKLLGVFVIIVTAGIILIGYSLNTLQFLLV